MQQIDHHQPGPTGRALTTFDTPTNEVGYLGTDYRIDTPSEQHYEGLIKKARRAIEENKYQSTEVPNIVDNVFALSDLRHDRDSPTTELQDGIANATSGYRPLGYCYAVMVSRTAPTNDP